MMEIYFIIVFEQKLISLVGSLIKEGRGNGIKKFIINKITAFTNMVVEKSFWGEEENG
ncbi:hypothetical protein [Parageobacillus thermoglucosidasius]|uniref:hypothetical protein n=1 Tax=Parageobacillus thermoglucosidasius TaxID=1426 RepID=UPI0002FD7579|nr:hypothetical protein [Parageobacillus thermoglucosidasius]